ncbi:hypothetical protein [Corynebacterium pseudotuberculosis]|uniref:hypothetical protein n=1 Tax=Corynebacterium pseudotuberculosis TaxID=1719 RepID=UPI0002605D7F|nr:hypothetical protein [Corynebacterium pseudotuberculosis]
MGKSSMVDIAKNHFKTLYDNQTARFRWQDFASQVVLLLVLGAVAWHFQFQINNAGTVISGVAIMAGLLCAMAVFLFQLRVDFRDGGGVSNPVLQLIDECMSNTLWAIAWGVFLSTYIATADAGKLFEHERWGGLVSGIAIAGALHFVLVIAMCLKRLGKSYDKFTALLGRR